MYQFPLWGSMGMGDNSVLLGTRAVTRPSLAAIAPQPPEFSLLQLL